MSITRNSVNTTGRSDDTYTMSPTGSQPSVIRN